jgi:hypothetical protein
MVYSFSTIPVCIALAVLFGSPHVNGQTPEISSEAVHWSRNEFVIPFQVDTSGEIPAEVRLEVSENRGQSWELFTRADVRTRQFRYQAPRDGEFRFRLKTVDGKGNVFDNPGEPLVVIVDTTKPDGELLVDVDPKGFMLAECRISDAALDPTSLKMEFQTDALHQWAPIACDLEPSGESDHWMAYGTWDMPTQASQLMVRVTVRDRAGNSAEWTRMPRLPRSAGKAREMKLASNREGADVSTRIGAGISRSPEPSQPSAPVSQKVAAPITGVPKIEVLGGSGTRRPQKDLENDAKLRDQMLESQQRLIEFQNRMLMQQRATNQPAIDGGVPNRSENPGVSTTTIRATRDLEPAATPTKLAEPTQQPRDTLHSNSQQFSLDYTIENEPDSPVSSVELWGTIDQGVSWEKWGTDADRQSPFDIEVEGDGLFGFRMVIAGANGIASKRPLPSDDADAWVRVDTTPPQARILSILNGKGIDTGSLMIEFQASDDFLGERPISFSCAATPDGPWQSIAQGARNDGRYVWTPDADLPPTVYVRLEVVDAAGNIAKHQLDLPVDVHGATPRGRIQGVRPQR